MCMLICTIEILKTLLLKTLLNNMDYTESIGPAFTNLTYIPTNVTKIHNLNLRPTF